MKRLLLSLGLCTLLSACFLLRGSPTPAGSGQCAPVGALPPLRQYPSGTPLPTQGTTHLVAGLCLSKQTLLVNGVDPQRGSLTFRLWASGPQAVQELLSQAQQSGLPFTLFTTPVSPGPMPGDSGAPPWADPCELIILGSQQGSELPKGGGGPTGEPPPDSATDAPLTPDGGVTDPMLARQLQAQRTFAQASVCAAQGLASSVDTRASSAP